MIKRFAGWTLLAAACLAGTGYAADGAGTTQAAEPVPLNPEHPTTYTVQPGDTLWGISEKFLQNPWQWPSVWHINEQIANPHRIRPGDVLRLNWGADGTPSITLDQGEVVSVGDDGIPVVKMQPKMRELPLSSAIPSIPLRNIKAFLDDSRVVSAEELAAAPRIVAGADKRIISGRGDVVYARDVVNGWRDAFPEYGVFRQGIPYKDPVTGELLGYLAARLGNARVVERNGDMATMRVLQSEEELRIGDKLMHNEQRAVQSTFFPRAAPEGTEGIIIDVFNTITYAARNDVVVINKGLRDRVDVGHVFAVLRQGETIRDAVRGDLVRTPESRAGLIIVFRAFDKVSYALVTRSARQMARGDLVKPPRLDIVQ